MPGGHSITNGGISAVSDELVRELEAMRDELVTEIRRAARRVILSVTTSVAVINSILLIALKSA